MRKVPLLAHRMRRTAAGVVAAAALSWATAGGCLPQRGLHVEPKRAVSEGTLDERGDPARELSHLRAEEAASKPPSADLVSRRLARIGVEYLSRGDAAQAIELLSEAVALDEQNGLALAELTLAYLRNGDVEFAEFYLRQARQIATRSHSDPQIYAALGYVYEAQGRIDDAILAWEEAVRIGGAEPALERRLERARREWALSHGQSFLEGASSGAFYDPAIPPEVVEETLRYLDGQRLELTRFFGAGIGRMPVVVLYQGKGYFALSDSPEWVGAVYDGRIHVPVPPDALVSEGYHALLTHELAHAFITELSRARAPDWLQEGIAEYVEGRRISAAEASRSLAVSPFHSMAELSPAFSQRSDWEQARAAYRLALFGVQELIGDHGSETAACLVRGLAAGRAIEDILPAETGSELADLEKEWRRKLRDAAHPAP